jgi:hypothetical protein
MNQMFGLDAIGNLFRHVAVYEPLILANAALALDQFAGDEKLPTAAEAGALSNVIGPAAYILVEMDSHMTAAIKGRILNLADPGIAAAASMLHRLAIDPAIVSAADTGVVSGESVPLAMAIISTAQAAIHATRGKLYEITAQKSLIPLGYGPAEVSNTMV